MISPSRQIRYTCRKNPDEFTFQHLVKTSSVVEMMDLVRSRISDSGLPISLDLAVRMLDVTSSTHFLLSTNIDYGFFLERVANRSLSIIEFDFFPHSPPILDSEFEYWTSSDVAELKELYRNKLPPDHPLSKLHEIYWNKPDTIPQTHSMTLGSENHQVHTFDIQSLPYLEETNGRMLIRPEYLRIQTAPEKLHWEHVSTLRGPSAVILVGQDQPSFQLLYGTLETIKKGRQALLYYQDVGYFFCEHGVFAASPNFLDHFGDCQQVTIPPFNAEMKMMAFIDHGVDPTVPPPLCLTHYACPFFPVVALSPALEQYHKVHRWCRHISNLSQLELHSWTQGELEMLTQLGSNIHTALDPTSKTIIVI
ncbi:hypothetical protein C8J56DRAFT_385132 [Mycena floridula]|nr:hypothetical protein C8J56DRAFT_385132 [Mycena floridula]